MRGQSKLQDKRFCIQCTLRIQVALTEISNSMSVFSTPRVQYKVKNQLPVTKSLYSMHVTNARSTDGDYYSALARALSDSTFFFLPLVFFFLLFFLQNRFRESFQPRKQVTTEPVDALEVLSDIIIC